MLDGLMCLICHSEFSLASGAQRPGQGGGMEWYESAGRSDYNFDTPAPSSSAAAYGTFEDEPPLLEGEHCARNVCPIHLNVTQHQPPAWQNCAVIIYRAFNSTCACQLTADISHTSESKAICDCRVGDRYSRYTKALNLYCKQQNTQSGS